MVTVEPVSSELPDATRGVPRAAWRSRRGVVRQWLWGDMRSRLAACVLAIVLLMAIAAPLIARYPPTAQNFVPFLGPSSAHWLGTDDLGRDVWSRLVYGARASMEAAGIAVSIALVIGMPIGLLAGFRGGWVDAVLMRVADTVLSFPGIILAIAITAVLGPSLVHSMIAVGIVFSPSIARLTRSQVLVTKERVYVDAAVSFGSPPWRIVMRHIVPNSIQPVVIQATFMLGLAVIADVNLIAGPYYHAVAYPWGPSLATSQVLGGGTLWILGDVVGLPFFAAQLIQMIREDEAEAKVIDAELDAKDAARAAAQGAGAVPTGAADSQPWWESDPRFVGRFQSVDDGGSD